MASYSDQTAVIASGTSEVSGTMKIPGNTRIVELQVLNVTGTGVVLYVRVDFPGAKTPQKYGIKNGVALQGTEVGSGTISRGAIPVDIPIPGGVSEVTFYVICDTASQNVYVTAKWLGA